MRYYCHAWVWLLAFGCGASSACSDVEDRGHVGNSVGPPIGVSPRPFDQTTNYDGEIQVVVALRDEYADWVDATSIADQLVPEISLSTWPGLLPVPATITYSAVPTSIYKQYTSDLTFTVTPTSALSVGAWYSLHLGSLPNIGENSWEPYGWKPSAGGGIQARFTTGVVTPRIDRVEFCPTEAGDTDVGISFNDLVWTAVSVDQAVHVTVDNSTLSCASVPPPVISEVSPTDRFLLTCTGSIAESASVIVSLDANEVRAKIGGGFLAAENHQMVLAALGFLADRAECRLYEVLISPP